MALIRSFTKDEVVYPEAYSRITGIRCDKNDAYVFVCTYSDEAARFADDFPIHAEEHMSPLSTIEGDIFPLAYNFIKTCPGFEGTLDHFAVDATIE